PLESQRYEHLSAQTLSLHNHTKTPTVYPVTTLLSPHTNQVVSIISLPTPLESIYFAKVAPPPPPLLPTLHFVVVWAAMKIPGSRSALSLLLCVSALSFAVHAQSPAKP